MAFLSHHNTTFCAVLLRNMSRQPFDVITYKLGEELDVRVNEDDHTWSRLSPIVEIKGKSPILKMF